MAVTERPHTARLRRPRTQRWYERKALHAVAGLAVAVLTTVFAGQRATDGVRASLDDRLSRAGAGADAGLVGVESEQLSAVRAVAFTQGVPHALATLDGATLNRFVTPLQANSTVPMVDVVRPDGRVILAVRSRGAPQPVSSYRGLRLLRQSLDSANGPRGGRYTELVIFKSGPALVSIGPVMAGNTPVGAVLAMTPLADVLGRLSQEVGADLTAYDVDGFPVATTTTFRPKAIPRDAARSLIAGGAVETRYVWADHREKAGRLIVDHAAEAVLGVSLEDDSNVTGRSVSIYVALGLLATVAVLATFWARYTRDREGP